MYRRLRVRCALCWRSVSVVPCLLAVERIANNQWIDVLPSCALPIQRHWRCWNFLSDVLDMLSHALKKRCWHDVQRLSASGLNVIFCSFSRVIFYRNDTRASQNSPDHPVGQHNIHVVTLFTI